MSNELRDRIFQSLADTPLIDIHTHLDADALSCGDLARLFFYHYLVDELEAAGADPEAIDPARSPEERLAAAMPFIPYVQNTSTYWMLSILSRDLLGFDEPLTPDNWPRLAAKVEQLCAASDWPAQVMHEANVELSFLTFNWNDTWGPFDRSLLRATVRLDTLLDGPVTAPMLRRLGELAGLEVTTAADLTRALRTLVARWQRSGVVALATSYENDYRLDDLSPREVDAALRVILSGEPGGVDAGQRLNGYFLHRALESCADAGLPMQVFVGISATTAGKRVPILRQNLVRALYPIFLAYPTVNFDILQANLAQSQESWVAVKMNPNVYVSGAWWYNFQPSTLRRLWHERLEGIPANKACAFFSDAYTIEWCYAKAYHVRSQLAVVLAERVADGFFDEAHACRIGRWLLYDNPKHLYLS